MSGFKPLQYDKNNVYYEANGTCLDLWTILDKYSYDIKSVWYNPPQYGKIGATGYGCQVGSRTLSFDTAKDVKKFIKEFDRSKGSESMLKQFNDKNINGVMHVIYNAMSSMRDVK